MRDSCYRHDFAYRNFEDVDMCGKDVRADVDTNFYNDMKNECAKQGDEAQREFCEHIATGYFEGVVAFGGWAWCS